MIQDIAPAALDNRFRPHAAPAAADVLFALEGRGVWCRRVDAPGAPPSFALPRVGELGATDARDLTYLFALDGTPCWLAPPAPRLTSCELVATEALRRERRGPKALMFALYTALHLFEWYRTNRHCGVCGQAMRPHGSLRALVCSACAHTTFPRLNPAVIVAVCDPVRTRIVLTRYAGASHAGIDALVAGFVEIGETLEQCVRREVREEVGLDVANIRYYKSQPWGVAGDILTGFWADVCGSTTIRMDASELGSAFWATPADVAGQPDDHSLTNEMMCVWRDAHAS